LIEFYLCYAYAVNPVSLTPMAYLRLRDLRSVRYPSLVAYPWIDLTKCAQKSEDGAMTSLSQRGQ
jgi:hypothetical protein